MDPSEIGVILSVAAILQLLFQVCLQFQVIVAITAFPPTYSP